MAWSTPLTGVANAALTAAQWNASVRDNLLETATAKATTAGSIFVGTGVNTLAERIITQAVVDTSETTATTSYTNLATNGPIISSLTTGVQAIVLINCQLSNSGVGSTAASFEITGATTDPAADNRAIVNAAGAAAPISCSRSILIATTPGSNTFRMQYKVGSGTGTFLNRRLIVMPL